VWRGIFPSSPAGLHLSRRTEADGSNACNEWFLFVNKKTRSRATITHSLQTYARRQTRGAARANREKKLSQSPQTEGAKPWRRFSSGQERGLDGPGGEHSDQNILKAKAARKEESVLGSECGVLTEEVVKR